MNNYTEQNIEKKLSIEKDNQRKKDDGEGEEDSIEEPRSSVGASSNS